MNVKEIQLIEPMAGEGDMFRTIVESWGIDIPRTAIIIPGIENGSDELSSILSNILAETYVPESRTNKIISFFICYEPYTENYSRKGRV